MLIGLHACIVHHNGTPWILAAGILNFVILRPGVYGKLEKPSFQPLGAEVSGLLARHSFPGSEESDP